MKIGVLTSSRADYGIYLPLLKKLEKDECFELEVIAFGTHLSRYHGYTVDRIKNDGFQNIHEISSIMANDDENSIATCFGLTALKFADFWHDHHFDWVFCLGDRFEMAAAVQAGVPYGISFAHLHGGETTLGAIDNIYRHQISLASEIHFPATEIFAERISQILDSNRNIYPVGSLSIEELEKLPIPSEVDFRKTYGIYGDFALLTFHPETVALEKNIQYANEMKQALKEISKTILLVITMPNADTNGTIYRNVILQLKTEIPESTVIVENFGKLNYFAAMKYCKLLIGNTSSGIIEAASFGKYVVNVGDRQKGRLQNGNILDASFEAQDIVRCYFSCLKKGNFEGENIYYRPNTVSSILNILKNKP